MVERSNQLEIIDLGSEYYTTEEYHDCLYQLDRVGRFLGGDKASFAAFACLNPPPTSILDVGCGGALFTMRLAARYPAASVVGLEISQEAIRFAQACLKEWTPPLTNIQFVTAESTAWLYPSQSFDVVTSTLVCHHLTDAELVTFIQNACQTAKQAVILNDLHRHFLASAGFATLLPFLFRNRLVAHDGLLSIKRAFKRSDWERCLKAAGVDPKAVTLTWHWAFRWIVFIDTTKMAKS